VVKAIQYPERVDRRGHSYFAIKAINAKYALRVFYEERKHLLVIPLYPVKRKHYSYKIKYDEEANVLMIIIAKEGKPSHAEEVGDTIMNSMKNNKPLFTEALRTGKQSH